MGGPAQITRRTEEDVIVEGPAEAVPEKDVLRRIVHGGPLGTSGSVMLVQVLEIALCVQPMVVRTALHPQSSRSFARRIFALAGSWCFVDMSLTGCARS